MDELTVLLPAYNEEENVETLVERWQQFYKPVEDKYGLSLQIVAVNDGSSDHTSAICEMLEKKYNNFTLVNHIKNKGLGEALKTAVTYVLESCPNSIYACLMDCDNTHDPKYIIDMLEKAGSGRELKAADVVIASRYQKGAKVQGVAKYRLLTSEGAKYVYSALLNVKGVKDYTCGYRLYSKEILVKAYKYFGNKIVEERDFTCMAELLYKLHIVNARFAEVPFELRYDFKLGQSKMKVVKTAINSIKLAFRLRRLKSIKQKDVQYEYINT